MNAIDDIRIRAGVEHLTDDEALAVIKWISDWVRQCEWRETVEMTLDEAWAYWDSIDLPALIRFSDHHIDGGLAFVLADVRRGL